MQHCSPACIGRLQTTDYCVRMVIVLSAIDELLFQAHEYSRTLHFSTLDTRISKLERLTTFATQRIQFRGSSRDCQLTFEPYCRTYSMLVVIYQQDTTIYYINHDQQTTQQEKCWSAIKYLNLDTIFLGTEHSKKTWKSSPKRDVMNKGNYQAPSASWPSHKGCGSILDLTSETHNYLALQKSL